LKHYSSAEYYGNHPFDHADRFKANFKATDLPIAHAAGKGDGL
jgi:hypothetical protein